jgi:hypothetical protein
MKILFVVIILCAVQFSFLQVNSNKIGGEPPSFNDSRAENFVYHNYSEMENELTSLEQEYPKLIEIDTAQDLFGLSDCRDGYKIWVVRITNEDITTAKPEVLYIGGHHGNEGISIEVPFYFIKWLLENYDTDENVKYIIDTRELYIVPVLNPYGWATNDRFDGFNEDINRDYPFGNESGNEALTTIGSRAIHELMKSHLFTIGLSWHSGDELIYYAWGTPLHNTINDESPDDKAYRSIGERLAEFAGNYDGKYIHGPANQVTYSAYAAWSDYAYAASWDNKGMDPAYPTSGSRMLSFGIEISTAKTPPESQLGTVVDIYSSPGDVDGYIPKNIRLAYTFAELAEPFIKVQNRTGLPSQAKPGENVTINWKVHGAVTVDQTNILHGFSANPVSNYDYTSANISGPGGLNGEIFSDTIQMPDEDGTYHFIIRARTDQNYKEQFVPEPLVAPQSIYVSSRTNDNWSYSNADRTATGELDYYSEVISIDVFSEPINASIEIIEFNTPEWIINSNATLRWKVLGAENIVEQIVHQTKYSEDNFDNSAKISEDIMEITTDNGTEYSIDFTLPSTWGEYFYMVEIKMDEDHSIFSEILHLTIYPYLEIISYPSETFVNETLTISWLFKGSNEPWNMTLKMYPKDPPGDVIDDRYNQGTIFGSDGEYNLTIIAPKTGGEYKLFISSQYSDENRGTIVIGSHTFTIFIKDTISVSTPKANYDSINGSLMITGIYATCSNLSHGYITLENTVTHEILIINENNEIIYFTDLLWSPDGWYVEITETDDWNEGWYYANASFWDGLHLGESAHVANDQSEFTILNQSDRPEKPNNGDGDNSGLATNLIILIFIIVLINIIGIILYVIVIKRPKKELGDEDEPPAKQKEVPTVLKKEKGKNE